MTEIKLIELGFQDNPNLWIGNGWMYCPCCKQYTYHKAMSRRVDGLQEDKLVCKTCLIGE